MFDRRGWCQGHNFWLNNAIIIYVHVRHFAFGIFKRHGVKMCTPWLSNGEMCCWSPPQSYPDLWTGNGFYWRTSLVMEENWPVILVVWVGRSIGWRIEQDGWSWSDARRWMKSQEASLNPACEQRIPSTEPCTRQPAMRHSCCQCWQSNWSNEDRSPRKAVLKARPERHVRLRTCILYARVLAQLVA